MSSLTVYSYLIISIIYVITGTLITQKLAKNNEWDSSYKTPFTIILIWGTITSGTGLLILFLTGNLSFADTQTVDLRYFSVITVIIPLIILLLIGPVIIKRFYNTEFRESFSMALKVIIYQGILQSFLLPIFLI